MAELYNKTNETTAKLRALGCEVEEKWEHEFLKEKKEEPMREFLKNHSLYDRLNPRDAFFGGRTNAIKLYFEGNVKYVDFTSLYPWVSSLFIYLFISLHICYVLLFKIFLLLFKIFLLLFKIFLEIYLGKQILSLSCWSSRHYNRKIWRSG